MSTQRPSHRRVLAVAAAVLVCGLVVAAAPTEKTKLQVFTALLTGGQETPANDSTAFGTGFFSLDTKTKILHYSISYTALDSGTTAAHFHGPATPFQTAGPLITLAATNPINGSTDPLTKDQLGALKKGLLYVNIHSTDFPGGEIRGQVLSAKTAYKFVPAPLDG